MTISPTSLTRDMDRALDIYSAIASGGPSEFMVALTIPGAPPSKARHRFGNGRTYKLPEDAANEQRTGMFLRRHVREPYTGNVALGCVFFRPNGQRIDTDNMLKHVCDAANGILWVDDSQVTAVMGVTELDSANPRTIIVIGRHESTLKRGTDNTFPCPVCGSPVQVHPSSQRRTCSRACAAASRGFQLLDEPVPCAQCSQPFKRTTKAQTMCSSDCRKAARRGAARSRQQPFSTCEVCGVELAHRRGGKCRSCWREALR